MPRMSCATCMVSAWRSARRSCTAACLPRVCGMSRPCSMPDDPWPGRRLFSSTISRTGATAATSNDFERRTDSAFARYKIENSTFPEPGYYYVEVYAEGESVDDQIL